MRNTDHVILTSWCLLKSTHFLLYFDVIFQLPEFMFVVLLWKSMVFEQTIEPLFGCLFFLDKEPKNGDVLDMLSFHSRHHMTNAD